MRQQATRSGAYASGTLTKMPTLSRVYFSQNARFGFKKNIYFSQERLHSLAEFGAAQ